MKLAEMGTCQRFIILDEEENALGGDAFGLFLPEKYEDILTFETQTAAEGLVTYFTSQDTSRKRKYSVVCINISMVKA